MMPEFWTTFIPLLTAHVLSDFVFQTDADVARKHRFGVLLKHVLVVTATSYVLLGVYGAWLLMAGVFVSHLAIDYAKMRVGKEDLNAFSLDQLGHLVVLAALAAGLTVDSDGSLWIRLVGDVYLDVLTVVLGAAVAVAAGAVVVGKAVDPFLLQMRASHEERREDAVPRHGFEQGGRLIGQLERALILLFVLADQLSGVGFLIAAKSILRIGEVKDRSHRMEAEYIIIGTLISFLWGLAAAFGTAWLFQV